MPPLTDEDILARLTAVEDASVERKTISDNRDWIKAAVAFSNSLEVGQPGLLFIGVRNDGVIEDRETNFERLQVTVTGEIGNVYPPIAPTILVREKGGKKFLAVIIYGSPNKPHFAGKSYVRAGTQTLEASEAKFSELIALRSAKVAELLKWKDRNIIVDHPYVGKFLAILLDCNQFWVTYRASTVGGIVRSAPLSEIVLNYDNQQGCLHVEITSARRH